MSTKPKLIVLFILILASISPAFAISDTAYYDKVRGAWLGKCIGGALGMPLESWRYTDIDKAYPNIDNYVGYFTSEWKGWSGMLRAEQVPTDGEWHRMLVRVDVPQFDSVRCIALPIVGMSFEFDKTPGIWEIRDLKIIRPKNNLGPDLSAWQADQKCVWTEWSVWQFDYQGERSWLKAKEETARLLNLKPADVLLFSFEARSIKGAPKIGFAFDFMTRDYRKGFGPDDDTSYQIVGLHVLETHGPDISCKDIGRDWCDLLPNISPELAEGLALQRMRQGIAPPESGVHPIGEAIGGQMKGEIWGLMCPGRPDLAAEYARRDGVVAHCKNGVYGEQFIAAMISEAFVETGVNKLIAAGLSVVPADSQYAQVVRWVIDMHSKYPDYRDTRRELIAKYPNPCNPVYADAGVVTLALLYGNGDFDKTIRIAASCGSDTDCDTASVGALMGCVHGANAIPAKWSDPIGDQFRCFVKGFENWKISDLSKRICAMGRKVQAYHGSAKKFSTDL